VLVKEGIVVLRVSTDEVERWPAVVLARIAQAAPPSTA
jgi:very-short-patch-repair endonuclease